MNIVTEAGRKAAADREANRVRLHEEIVSLLSHRKTVSLSQLQEFFNKEDEQDLQDASWRVLTSGQAQINDSYEFEYESSPSPKFWY